MVTTQLRLVASVAVLLFASGPASGVSLKSKLDTHVPRLMQETGAKGLAIAVIENGHVQHVQAWGARNAKGDPLSTSTIRYGASLT